MQRVIAYIDGYNLYFGLREKRWKRFYWLNLQSLVMRLLQSDQVLIHTHYFTTVVKQPEDKRKRQSTFLEALRTLPNFDIHYGQFMSDTIVCRNCGHTYLTHHEKMTDVNIAVQMLCDVYQNQFDTALLISADSDLVGPMQAVHSLFPQKRTIVAFPPGRSSKSLMQAASGYLYIGRDVLAASVFPEQVTKSDGFILHCPQEWR